MSNAQKQNFGSEIPEPTNPDQIDEFFSTNYSDSWPHHSWTESSRKMSDFFSRRGNFRKCQKFFQKGIEMSAEVKKHQKNFEKL